MEQEQIDSWLNDGGWIIAATDRAARALRMNYHQARMKEDSSAWFEPRILDWKSFLREQWQQLAADGRLLLNPMQETAIWEQIIASDASLNLLAGPRHRLAKMADDAHELLCGYAPQMLEPNSRHNWFEEAEKFSNWLDAFEQICATEELISLQRCGLELASVLESHGAARPALLLIGFDRILPAQRLVLDAWGEWQQRQDESAEQSLHFFCAPDRETEIEACALWAAAYLRKDPQCSLLIVAQSNPLERGVMERIFARHLGARFEFSLGQPLNMLEPVQAAQLTLRWLSSSLEEAELDWLLGCTHLAADQTETNLLTAALSRMRKMQLERPEWTLIDLLAQATKLLPDAWRMRMIETQRMLQERSRQPKRPLEWVELTVQLLAQCGASVLRTAASSEEWQVNKRFMEVLEGCASIGFLGQKIKWQEFVQLLNRQLAENLFAPESQSAPVLIAGPAESAGLTADGIWFLGADESGWPLAGQAHPLLPTELQRVCGMPHGSPQLDWEQAGIMLRRLLASSPEFVASYSRLNGDAEASPSRMMQACCGMAIPLPQHLLASEPATPLRREFTDAPRLPYPPGDAPAGSGLLTAQSLCPFQAFATGRLQARKVEAAMTGLTAAQRGNLVHAALAGIWSGAPDGIASLNDLLACTDRSSLVAKHVKAALLDGKVLPAHVRDRMPRRYLELEEQRLCQLLALWLDYEATRQNFHVEKTEGKLEINLAGLVFHVRPDRLDRLADDSLLVIDYKTGDKKPGVWLGDRPEDVQLPLYASLACGKDETVGGLAFARLRPNPNERNFAGLVRDARTTLQADLSPNSTLVKNPLTDAQLQTWREQITALAQDFLAGKAEVDPLTRNKACKYCGLEGICRINEQSMQEDEEEGEIDE